MKLSSPAKRRLGQSDFQWPTPALGLSSGHWRPTSSSPAPGWCSCKSSSWCWPRFANSEWRNEGLTSSGIPPDSWSHYHQCPKGEGVSNTAEQSLEQQPSSANTLEGASVDQWRTPICTVGALRIYSLCGRGWTALHSEPKLYKFHRLCMILTKSWFHYNAVTSTRLLGVFRQKGTYRLRQKVRKERRKEGNDIFTDWRSSIAFFTPGTLEHLANSVGMCCRWEQEGHLHFLCVNMPVSMELVVRWRRISLTGVQETRHQTSWGRAGPQAPWAILSRNEAWIRTHM